MPLFSIFGRRTFAAALAVVVLGGAPGPAVAQMTPGAPVKNFRLPRFGEDGYTQWVLRGGQGIYDNEERIRVVDMDLRVYSADARMALEMSMESPEATLLAKKNRAVSDSSLEIRGANFELSGRGWRWDGDTKVIEVDHDAEVRFAGEEPGTGGRTVVSSERLRLQTTPEDYRFIFSEDVRVTRGETRIEGGALLAFADAPEGESAPAAAQGRIESIRRILAREEVVMQRDGWTAYAGEVEYFPAEDRAELRQLPRIEAPGAYIAGASMKLAPGAAEVSGGGEAGRAQAILSRAGQLGLGGSAALSSETIVLADTIVMASLEDGGNRFDFEGSVELMSGPLQVTAGRLQVESERDGPAGGDDAGAFSVQRVTAANGVVIERDGYRATGEEAVFLPLEESAVLSGEPRVTGEGLDVAATRLHLLPDGALAESGEDGATVRVALPALPDLGYDLSALPVAEENRSDTLREETGTVVRSRTVRVHDEEGGRRFVFSGEVSVEATNLESVCDEMVAWTGAAGEEGLPGMRINRIEATGDVEVIQEGRRASAGRAIILPREGKLVLEENAVVEDGRGRASGTRVTVLRGERRAIVEGDAASGERARITLPGLGDGP